MCHPLGQVYVLFTLANVFGVMSTWLQVFVPKVENPDFQPLTPILATLKIFFLTLCIILYTLLGLNLFVPRQRLQLRQYLARVYSPQRAAVMINVHTCLLWTTAIFTTMLYYGCGMINGTSKSWYLMVGLTPVFMSAILVTIVVCITLNQEIGHHVVVCCCGNDDVANDEGATNDDDEVIV